MDIKKADKNMTLEELVMGRIDAYKEIDRLGEEMYNYNISSKERSDIFARSLELSGIADTNPDSYANLIREKMKGSSGIRE